MSWLYSRALMDAYENSRFSPELGEEFSEGIFSAGEQSAQSNGNLTPQAYLSNDKMTAFSRLSRSGITFKPLTAAHGEALLTWYLAGFRVKTSAQQGKAQGSTESGPLCGDTWRGWLAKYDPNTSSWKTAQCSLLADSEESLETFPRWGMTRNGLLWERPTLAPIMSASASGFRPDGVTTFHTPNTTGLDGGSNSRKALRKRQSMLPTPTCHNAKEGNYQSEQARNTPLLATPVGGKIHPHFTEWLMGWPTGWTDLKPLAMDKFRLWQKLHGSC